VTYADGSNQGDFNLEFILLHDHRSDTLLVSLKIKCQKVGKHALEFHPNSVVH